MGGTFQKFQENYRLVAVADWGQTFGRTNKYGIQQVLDLYLVISDGENCWISQKVVTFFRPRQWVYLLVKLSDPSDDHHSFKSFVSLIQKFFERVQKHGTPFFTRCTMINNAVGVCNNLLNLQKLFEKYALKCDAHSCFNTSLAIPSTITVCTVQRLHFHTQQARLKHAPQ